VTPFTKSRLDAPPGFFAAEARGIEWLRTPDGPPLPDVIEVTDTTITMTRIEETTPSTSAADAFGRALAAMHRAEAPAYGADSPGFIGPLPLDNTPGESWPEWYLERRVLPYLRQAVERGAIDPDGARVIERACDQLSRDDEPPSRIHGDLWSGNVLWGVDGRCWLIDPAAHGGHRETDLAMLIWSGAPHLERILASYDEAWPLRDGWRGRIGLHQLHPLLVHAALFGGSYGPQAVATAARY
jgi:fructosamine-3-kinase